MITEEQDVVLDDGWRRLTQLECLRLRLSTSTKAGAMEVLNMFTAEALKLDDVDIMKFTRSVAVRVQERYK